MTTAPRESVVFVLPDAMGGMLNIVANLLAHRDPDGFSYHAVLTHNRLGTDTRFTGTLAADASQCFEHSLPLENLHAVIRRLHRALPRGRGVLVTNDLLELAMASAIDTGHTVITILHGDHDYYYDLAARHQDVIDAYVCYGRTMFETLQRRLPERAGSILHLPYGIPLPHTARAAAAGPLRLLYAGRLEHGQKGVLDLPQIDRALERAGVAVRWTIVGAGPHEAELRAQWGSPAHVQWLGVQPNDRVLELAAQHDVFVLPTRAEGFPVALVEAMAVGLVPVVSDLPSGIREVMTAGVHGYTPGVGDIGGFVDAIRSLASDRARLEAMSGAARARVTGDFDIRHRVRAYQQLFARHHELRRPRSTTVRLPYGSRLDRRWIPNAAVKAVRTVMRRAAGKAR